MSNADSHSVAAPSEAGGPTEPPMPIPEILFPRTVDRGLVGTEGKPIPAPTYLREEDGECERVIIINCALWDVRSAEPRATSYRVAEWIDAYLTYWEQLRAADRRANT